MGQITVELDRHIRRISKNDDDYTIPRGTKFIVDEKTLDYAKETNSFIEVIYQGKSDGVRSRYLNKIATPLQYNIEKEKVTIEVIINTATELIIGEQYIIDKNEWQSNSNVIYIDDKRRFFKEFFKLVDNKFYEDSTTFPSIPNTIDTKFGKAIVYGTGGKDKINTDLNTWGNDQLNKSPQQLPKHYSNLPMSPQDYYLAMMNHPNLENISPNNTYKPVKDFKKEIEELAKYYDYPSLIKKDYQDIKNPFNTDSNNIFPTEDLHDRLNEIKQKGYETIRIPSQKIGRGIKEQIELAEKTGILTHDYSQPILWQKSRRVGGMQTALMMKHLWESLLTKPKDLLKNITIPKRIKKKKQIIVESMNNIKL